MLLGFIPIDFILAHQDVVLNVTNIMLWHATWVIIPKEHKGHIRRGVRVIRATRITRHQRFILAVRVDYERLQSLEAHVKADLKDTKERKTFRVHL